MKGITTLRPSSIAKRIPWTIHSRKTGPRQRVPILGMLLLVLGTLFPRAAAAQGNLTLDARAGFDGYYKVNSWVPIHVVVANDGEDVNGRIEVTVQETLGGGVRYTQPAVLATHSRKQFTMYVPVRDHARELVVRLVQDVAAPRLFPGQAPSQRTVLATQTIRIDPLSEHDLLFGIVSDDPAALNYLAGLTPVGSGRVRVAHLALPDLPGQGRALDSIDALVLHNLDSSLLDTEQRQALRHWVSTGGHLIVCGGPNAISTAAGLGEILDIHVTGTEITADVAALGNYAGAPFTPGVPAIVARASLTSPQATILAGSVERPLLIQQELDRGRISYLALDPNMDPMRTWIGSDSFWSKLVLADPPFHILNQNANWGNMDSALNYLSRPRVPSALLVMAFLLFYVVIVGPLNFLILKKLDRRTLAWVTVPVLIVLFSCVAYVFGFFSRGSQVIVNEISIVRALPQSGTAAIESYARLYSPARRTYDVRLTDRALVHRPTYPYYSGRDTNEEMTIEQGSPAYLRQLEIDVGATRDVALHTMRPWPGIEADLQIVSTVGGRYRVTGTLLNRGDSDIKRCALILNGEPVLIADLPAGKRQQIEIDLQSQPPNSNYQFITILLGDLSGSAERRERDLKREILDSVVYSSYSPGTTPAPYNGSELTLIGWIEKSPVEVDVQDTLERENAIALLIAPLPVVNAD